MGAAVDPLVFLFPVKYRQKHGACDASKTRSAPTFVAASGSTRINALASAAAATEHRRLVRQRDR